MRTGRRFRGWVTVAALGVSAAPGFAQSPAARLVPIDPDKAPVVPVARSAYPDIPETDVFPVPVQGYDGRPTITPPEDRPRSWVGGAWSGVKEFVIGKPVSAETPATPAAPSSVRLPQPRPVPPPVPMPVPLPAQPTAAPQVSAPTATPQPGVYAGPPAYRWYGWGSTTPGANQYAPHGLYPKGSANWHAHTGASPGAFPIPIQYPDARPGIEPPTYTRNPHTYEAAYVAPSREVPPEPESEPLAPARPQQAARPQPTVEPPPSAPLPAPPAPRELPLPVRPRVVTAEAPPSELDWRTAPALPTQPPAPAKPPQATPPSASEPKWVPAANHPGTVVPAVATAPVARGQQQPPAPDIATQIRAVCHSRVNQVRVTPTGERALTVTFVTTTEQLAREAANLVSQLPAVRPYAVQFEVQLTK